MTTNNLPIARTDSNGTTWYPASDGMGWTANVAFAAPHVLAMDDVAAIVIPADLAPLVEAAPTRRASSHADCDHASTKAARAACRRARNA